MCAEPTFTQQLIAKLQLLATAATGAEFPSYNAADASVVDLLATSSTPVQVQLGTGADIYSTTLIPAILAAKLEVILVTCFWAKSKTLSALGEALHTLASHRRALIDSEDRVPPLRMHICFSSRSFLQKLFHTSSRAGHIYPPSSWHDVLGLPPVEVLQAGHIELQVKTLFFVPFSVMHPKFLIIDRQRAFIPSCNVSWEAWLEGCVEIRGPAVVGLLDFFARTWNQNIGELPHFSRASQQPSAPLPPQEPILSSIHHCEPFSPAHSPIPTVILPSPHHRNPNFRPFPWQTAPPPPPTPLNIALLHLVNSSIHSIYVQTPNLTCAPVISALLDALSRGVNVNIVTSRNMMVLEQLLTAGTTTSWCVRSLIRRYRAMVFEAARSARETRSSGRSSTVHAEASDGLGPDLEAQYPMPGQLRIAYFQPLKAAECAALEQHRSLLMAPEEPVHSHLKLTVVDREYTVLGSGNMDRASWYTSQELGILFQSRDFAASTMKAVSEALDGRLNIVFESH